LYKAELVGLSGPWDGVDDVEAATAEWVGWFNHERLHSMLDYQTPAEVETAYWDARPAADTVATAA
jgi:putative transposase